MTTQRRRQILTTFGAASLWLTFLAVHATYSIQTGDALGLAFFVQLTLITYLFLHRKEADRTSQSPRDWIVGFGGGFLPFLLRPDGAAPSWGPFVAIPLMVIGLALSFFALMELGRSFGIVAADRGIVSSGPYTVVRHPAYIAYAIGEIGYMFQSFSTWNIAIAAMTWACQIARIRAEEELLSGNLEYVQYKDRVRYALIPGVW